LRLLTSGKIHIATHEEDGDKQNQSVEIRSDRRATPIGKTKPQR